MMRPSLLFSVLLLSACSANPASIVPQPYTTRPVPVMPAAAPANGAIYQPQNNRLVLFEDRRARYVGDTLTIRIQERLSASTSGSTNASRSNSMKIGASVPFVPGIFEVGGGDKSVNMSSSNEFKGKGDSAANNSFIGTITVHVLEVLPNGNLVVAGEKQIAINREQDFIRLSGVVNPADIDNSNAVPSTKVADARIEQRGQGTVDSAQIMGWLARFFASVIPF